MMARTRRSAQSGRLDALLQPGSESGSRGRLMAEITVTEPEWRGVGAWRLAGGDLEIVVTRVGAHLAAITGRGERLNPLWQPPWSATSPQDGVDRPDVYGGGPEASLLAGIVGHNLCLDRFGPPRPGESRPVHAEAGVATWKLV